MNNKIYVFDLDGTLVDSMPYFTKGILSIADDAGIEYGPELIRILTPLGYVGGAKYYIEHYGLNDTVDNIVKKICDRLVYEYSNNVILNPGVGEYLRRIKAEGGRLFVLTASPHLVTDVCLQRNGVYDLFEKVWSVEDFKLTKSDTRLFYRVSEAIGCQNNEIHYFDDSLVALANAKRSDYITYAVYDAQNDEEIATMKAEYNVYVRTFEDLL